ncbi:MAG: T9SS type A sorting domain-containing protein [Opitutaceae bacterium]|nr:T9SS type A sorting domain-containing protein [Cytophagales bacterium]
MSNYSGALDLSGNNPRVDNITGKIIKVFGTDNGPCLPNTPGIFGCFFNWKFSTSQKYCDRKPVVLKPCIVAGNEENETITSNFKLYPNPSNSFFTLACTQPTQIRVLDFNGKEIENKTINGTEQIGDSWPSGIYVLLVNAGNSSCSYKLSKIR